MARSKWIAAIERKALATLKKFTKTSGVGVDSLSLVRVAREFKIESIRFEPLLSDAGLKRLESGGLEIVINTDASYRRVRHGTVMRIEDGGELSKLNPYLRFTVAHEIAHAIVLEISGGDSSIDEFKLHEDAVESVCNRMAGALLVPEKALDHALGGIVFDAEHLQRIAGEFHVSMEVLVLRIKRLKLRERGSSFGGLLLLVGVKSGKASVRIPYADQAIARQLFLPFVKGEESRGQVAEELTPSESTKVALSRKLQNLLRFLGGDEFVEHCEQDGVGHFWRNVPYRKDEGDYVKCLTSYSRIGNRWLIAVRVISAPFEGNPQN